MLIKMIKANRANGNMGQYCLDVFLVSSIVEDVPSNKHTWKVSWSILPFSDMFHFIGNFCARKW